MAIYKSYYEARKARVTTECKVVKVEGGYMIMDYASYIRWKKQR